MKKLTGPAVVLASPHSGFDPLNPGATPVLAMTYMSASVLGEDGKLGSYWVELGYVYVGHALITIDLLPTDDIAARAVDALKTQKTKVLADAHAEATRIEGRIQSLLAIAN